MNSKYSDQLRNIGIKISSIRKSKGLTQEDLAIKASISYSYLTKIEAPNCQTSFSIETLFDLASALEVSPRDLL